MTENNNFASETKDAYHAALAVNVLALDYARRHTAQSRNSIKSYSRIP